MAARDHDLVACEGEWDISRAREFRRRTADGLARCKSVLILDFRPAAFVDASTVGAICALAGEAERLGVPVVVTCGAGAVRRVFDLTHLTEVVPVAESVEGALRAARI